MHGPFPAALSSHPKKVKTMPSTFDVVTEKQTTHQIRSTSRKAFDAVTDQLQELLTKTHAGFHPGQTTAADYRADAALAAKAVLSARDYLLWQNSFLNFVVPEACIPAEIVDHIRLTVGKAFARRRLNKTASYFAKVQKSK
jgi:hypothetical protein